MNYQLANGRTIRMTEEQFFKMTEQDLKDLEGSSYGYMINDPFHDSILGGSEFDDFELEEEIEEIPEIDLDIEKEEE